MQNASADGSTKPGAFTVTRTGANGVFTVGDPVGPYHATNKQYVDTALEGKLDKITTTYPSKRIYGIGEAGNQQELYVETSSGRPNWIVQFVPNASYGGSEPPGSGTIVVKSPIKPYQVANKKYIDEGMWLPAYDETITYAKDVMVVKDGKIYKSLIDDNIGNLGNAETEATSWEDLLSGKIDVSSFLEPKSDRRQVMVVNTKADAVNLGKFSVRDLANYVISNAVVQRNGEAIKVRRTPLLEDEAISKIYADEQIASVKKYYNHGIHLMFRSADNSEILFEGSMSVISSSSNSIMESDLPSILSANKFIVDDNTETAYLSLAPYGSGGAAYRFKSVDGSIYKIFDKYESAYNLYITDNITEL